MTSPTYLMFNRCLANSSALVQDSTWPIILWPKNNINRWISISCYMNRDFNSIEISLKFTWKITPTKINKSDWSTSFWLDNSPSGNLASRAMLAFCCIALHSRRQGGYTRENFGSMLAHWRALCWHSCWYPSSPMSDTNLKHKIISFQIYVIMYNASFYCVNNLKLFFSKNNIAP